MKKLYYNENTCEFIYTFYYFKIHFVGISFINNREKAFDFIRDFENRFNSHLLDYRTFLDLKKCGLL